jgi:hypothetical protein
MGMDDTAPRPTVATVEPLDTVSVPTWKLRLWSATDRARQDMAAGRMPDKHDQRLIVHYAHLIAHHAGHAS